MVVEDEPGIRMVLQRVLTGEGYEAVVAPDGLAALQQLKLQPLPDLVITDLSMPRLGGKAMVESMRSDPALRDIPVIIMTGTVPGEGLLPPEGTYQALVAKPFDLWELVGLVASLAGAARGAGDVPASVPVPGVTAAAARS
ncbi:MAG: response regulator [Bacillota bacterium]|nr:response regulator [Bacillota bacterium]